MCSVMHTLRKKSQPGNQRIPPLHRAVGMRTALLVAAKQAVRDSTHHIMISPLVAQIDAVFCAPGGFLGAGARTPLDHSRGGSFWPGLPLASTATTTGAVPFCAAVAKLAKEPMLKASATNADLKQKALQYV